MDRADGVDKFFKEIIPAAVKKAKDNGSKVIFGSGWDMMKFPKDLNYRKQLDAICSDIRRILGRLYLQATNGELRAVAALLFCHWQ
jgi:hypothetical protein